MNKIQFYCEEISKKKVVLFKHLFSNEFSEKFCEFQNITKCKHPRQLIWHVQNNTTIIPKCNACHINEVVWVKNTNRYRGCCSHKCAAYLTRKIKIPKIKKTPWYKDPMRVAEISAKHREKCFINYGVEHFSQRQDVKDKIAKTNNLKYGSKSYLTSKEGMEKISKIILDKYGVDNVSKSSVIQDRKRKSNLIKYGFDHHMKNSEIRQKHYDSMILNHGVAFALQNPDLKQKFFNTNLEKFGYISPFASPEIQSQIIQKCQNTHGVDNYAQIHIPKDIMNILKTKELFENIITNKTLSEICEELNISLRCILNYLKEYDLRDKVSDANISSYERKMSNFLDDLGIKYIKGSYNIINPFQLDFYIPDHKLAIEVGSSYFHSELSAGKTQFYHFNKWKLCCDQNITLLQFFDDDILENFDRTKSHIEKIITKRNDCGNYDIVHDENKVYINSFDKKCFEINLCENDIIVHANDIIDENVLDTFYNIGISKFKLSVNNKFGFDYYIKDLGFMIFKIIEPNYRLTNNYTSFIDDIELTNDEKYDKIWDAGKTVWDIELS